MFDDSDDEVDSDTDDESVIVEREETKGVMKVTSIDCFDSSLLLNKEGKDVTIFSIDSVVNVADVGELLASVVVVVVVDDGRGSSFKRSKAWLYLAWMRS